MSATHSTRSADGAPASDSWSAAAVDGLKTVAGAVFGAAAGLLLFSLIPGSSAGATFLAVLVGVTLGVLALGPGRPKALEDWLGRGLLAVAMAVVGGMLVVTASTLVGAWAACSVALALASHDPTTGKRTPRPHFGEIVFRAAMAAAATGLAFYVLLSGNGSLGAPSVMALASIMGVGGFLAGWMEVEPADASGAPALPSRPAKTAKGKKANKPGKATVDASFDDAEEGDGDDGSMVFAEEFARLEAVAGRVEDLLERTERENPEEEAFVEGIRERVQTMMEQVQASVRRWRKAGDEFEAERLAEIREQLETNQVTLEGMGDPAMRRELTLAIERQERMLSMLQSMERSRTTFGFRLAQVTSGLELLEVTLKRALTVGEGIDTSEIDALVEVMDAFDDDDVEPVENHEQLDADDDSSALSDGDDGGEPSSA